MKVSCTQENLTKGLGIVSHMVGTRTTLPVLNNILLKTEKGRLKLSATDLEIGINTWVGAKVDMDGAVTVPARILTEFVNTNTDKTISFELKDSTISAKSEHFKANIKGIDAGEFPLIPEVAGGKTIEISATELKDGISKTVFACALDETRPVLAGIYMKLSAGKMKMVATDSYRLAEKTLNTISKDNGEMGFIVPQRTMAEIGRLIDESIEKVEIKIGENQVQFKLGPTEISSRLIEGNFPDYEQIIPAKTKTTVKLATSQLANAIKMASFFARETANNIKFQVAKPDKLQILAVSPQLGDNVADLQATVTGEDINIAFNAKFISDALQGLNSEQVNLEFAGAAAPGMIRPEKDPNYLYIIMPLRTDE